MAKASPLASPNSMLAVCSEPIIAPISPQQITEDAAAAANLLRLMEDAEEIQNGQTFPSQDGQALPKTLESISDLLIPETQMDNTTPSTVTSTAPDEPRTLLTATDITAMMRAEMAQYTKVMNTEFTSQMHTMREDMVGSMTTISTKILDVVKAIQNEKKEPEPVAVAPPPETAPVVPPPQQSNRYLRPRQQR